MTAHRTNREIPLLGDCRINAPNQIVVLSRFRDGDKLGPKCRGQRLIVVNGVQTDKGHCRLCRYIKKEYKWGSIFRWVMRRLSAYQYFVQQVRAKPQMDGVVGVSMLESVAAERRIAVGDGRPRLALTPPPICVYLRDGSGHQFPAAFCAKREERKLDTRAVQQRPHVILISDTPCK